MVACVVECEDGRGFETRWELIFQIFYIRFNTWNTLNTYRNNVRYLQEVRGLMVACDVECEDGRGFKSRWKINF